MGVVVKYKLHARLNDAHAERDSAGRDDFVFLGADSWCMCVRHHINDGCEWENLVGEQKFVLGPISHSISATRSKFEVY